MTIEQLLDLPTESLEAMSDEELAEHLRPYFPHTRAAGVISKQLSAMEDDPALAEALAAAEAERRKGVFSLSKLTKKPNA